MDTISSVNAIAIILSSILILGGTFLITTLINRRSNISGDDWAIGGRDLPIYVVIGTQFASCFGGGILVAQVGNAFKNGFSVLIYGFLVCFSFVIFCLFAKWLRNGNFTTIPDILLHFSGKHSKRVAVLGAIMALVTPFGWIGSQVVAFGKLYSPMTGISMHWLIIALCVISIFFVMPAGLRTVAWTDFIFSCFIILMCTVILIKAITMGGGPAEVYQNIPKELITFPDFVNKLGWGTAILWIFSVLPGNMTNQLYYQRICAIDNPKGVNKSLLLTAFFSFLGFVWATVMGLTIRTINPTLEPELATGWLMSQLPLILLAAFAGLLVATLMSTISSAVQSVVVNITSDIYPVVNPKATAEKQLRLSRFFTVVVLAIAAVLSIKFPNVLNWFIYTYTFSAASLLCPIFVGYALRNKNMITEQGVFYSMIFGTLGCIVSLVIGIPIPEVIVGIVASFVSLLVISNITKEKNQTVETEHSHG